MEKRLKILVANDDGIQSEGIMRLARMASQLGDVWVAAPSSQCSGMSQKLTIADDIIVKKVDFPVPVNAAYSIGGTPADCVKIAVSHLLPVRLDYVFSGINYGYNAGFDIAYSGTLGASLEAVMNGIPAIAFSSQHDGTYDVAEEYMLPLAKELIGLGQAPGEIWNINFPGCPLGELKGILRGRTIADIDLYDNEYTEHRMPDGSVRLSIKSRPTTAEAAPEGSDVRAVLSGYISVGKVKCAVL